MLEYLPWLLALLLRAFFPAADVVIFDNPCEAGSLSGVLVLSPTGSTYARVHSRVYTLYDNYAVPLGWSCGEK